MVVTHYDVDHVGGVTQLLRMPGVATYLTLNIFDQGWATAATVTAGNTYSHYLRAVNGLPAVGGVALMGLARIRVTNQVASDPGNAPLPIPTQLAVPIGLPASAGPLPGALINGPGWLLGQEILWHGFGGVPVGAPTVTCIAANGFVNGVGGPFFAGIGIGRHANEMSLAFHVHFGNFTYYVGGDIETFQETQLQAVLNAGNNAAGRVLAMKTSHHGSRYSTSRAFIDVLRPDAAFISCGTNNQYAHPATETVNVLDGYPANPMAPLPAPYHAPAPPTPPNRAIPFYLTGYDRFPGDGLMPAVVALQSLGDASITAGDPLTANPGHILLIVIAAQSAQNAVGLQYLTVQAAVNQTALALVALAAAAAALALQAAESAMSLGTVGAAHDATAAVAATLGIAAAAGPVVVAAAAGATIAVNAGASAAMAAIITAYQTQHAALLIPAAAANAADLGAIAGAAAGASIHTAPLMPGGAPVQAQEAVVAALQTVATVTANPGWTLVQVSDAVIIAWFAAFLAGGAAGGVTQRPGTQAQQRRQQFQ